MIVCAVSTLVTVPRVMAQESAGKNDAEPLNQADVNALIRQLDAEDYESRERATEALVEQGEAIRKQLEDLAKDPPSAEVRVRIQKICRGIELAEIRRNAVKL